MHFVEILVQNGADPNLETWSGRTRELLLCSFFLIFSSENILFVDGGCSVDRSSQVSRHCGHHTISVSKWSFSSISSCSMPFLVVIWSK